VDIEVIPGISAMQAGASRVGAMLGHDFCTISLSDLLTPWETIDKRLHGMWRGRLCRVFYNPVSKKRDWQLNHARDVLLQYRPASTPVMIGRQLTRPEEKITFTTLGELDAKRRRYVYHGERGEFRHQTHYKWRETVEFIHHVATRKSYKSL